MNKYLRIMVITLLVVLVCISVNFASVAQESVEISMCVFGMPWEDYLYVDVAMPKFQKANPNIKVKFNRYEDYWTKIVTLYAAGEAPDVVRDVNAFLGLHAAKGMMRSLDEFLPGPDGVDMSDFLPFQFQPVAYLGYTAALPTDIDSYYTLSYNKTLFDEAGISYPNYDWTLDDLESAAKKTTGGSKYGFLWEDSEYLIPQMVWKMGGTIFDPENPEKLTVDSPEGVKAVKLIQKWIFDDKIVPPFATGKVRTSAIQLFSSGRLAMFTHGQWLIPGIKRDVPNLKFGTTLFPRLNKDTNPGSINDGTVYFMNADTKYPKEAWKLLKYLTSTEGIMDYWQAIWVGTPARYSVLNSPEFKTPRGLKDKVPGIRDEEEYVEKLKFHRDAVENNWIDLRPLCARYGYLLPSVMMTAAETLLGTERGDPEKVLKEAVEEFSRQVALAKK